MSTDLISVRRLTGKAGPKPIRHPQSCFAQLEDGRCHFRLDLSRNGPLVLLMHGATVPSWQFDRILPYLAAAGFRTLSVDMFGHGDSDRPAAEYTIEMFSRQYRQLIEYLSIDEPLRIISHSLGSVVAAQLVAEHPDRFESVVLHAPMLDFEAIKPLTRILKAPGVGELVMKSVIVPALMRERIVAYREIEDGRWIGYFRRQIEAPGFGEALLSIIRQGCLGDRSEDYRSLEQTRVPCLVCYGSEDVVLGRDQVERILGLLPWAEYREVRGADHGMLMTHPEIIGPAMAEFLSRTHR